MVGIKKLGFGILVLILLAIVSGSLSLDEIKVKEYKTNENVTEEFVQDEVLVKFKTGTLPARAEEILDNLNVTKISEIEKLNVLRLKIQSNETVSEIINRFEKKTLLLNSPSRIILFILLLSRMILFIVCSGI